MRCTDLSVSFLNLKIRKKEKRKKKEKKDPGDRLFFYNVFIWKFFSTILTNDFVEAYYIYRDLNEERYITEEHFAKRIRGLNWARYYVLLLAFRVNVFLKKKKKKEEEEEKTEHPPPFNHLMNI